MTSEEKLLQTKFHLQGLSFLSSLNKLISGWGPDRSNYWLILKGHGFIAKQHNWFYSIIQQNGSLWGGEFSAKIFLKHWYLQCFPAMKALKPLF